MLRAAGQAFRELFSPSFRAILFKCLGFTVGLLALIVIGLHWLFSYYVAWPGWIETTAEWLLGAGLVVGSIFLIPPVTSLIAGLYLDDIAAEVERVNYPADMPGQELPTFQTIWLAVKFFFVVLAVNLIAVFLLLIPGVNLVAFYLGNGYLLGREYFEMVAMRHLPAGAAKELRRVNSVYIFVCGLIIAVVASVPILNLLTPIFATAFMVRIYKLLARRAGFVG